MTRTGIPSVFRGISHLSLAQSPLDPPFSKGGKNTSIPSPEERSDLKPPLIRGVGGIALPRLTEGIPRTGQRTEGTNANGGFSLIELLAAAALMSIALLTVFSLLNQCLVVHETNLYRDKALNAAQNEIEKFKALTPQQRAAGIERRALSDVPNGRVRKVVTNENGLWSIDVRVGWKRKATKDSLRLFTYLAESEEP